MLPPSHSRPDESNLSEDYRLPDISAMPCIKAMAMKRIINSAITITPFHRVPAVKTRYSHQTKIMPKIVSIKTSIVRVRNCPIDHRQDTKKGQEHPTLVRL
jgi:hypothetical protein